MSNEKNNKEKPFNFGKFMFVILVGFVVLTGIVILVPYFLMK